MPNGQGLSWYMSTGPQRPALPPPTVLASSPPSHMHGCCKGLSPPAPPLSQIPPIRWIMQAKSWWLPPLLPSCPSSLCLDVLLSPPLPCLQSVSRPAVGWHIASLLLPW
jgi:hypothetical protein